MNTIYWPVLPPTPLVLADVTTQMISGAGQASSQTSKASDSWSSWLSPWLAIPVALPLAGYGLYRLFQQRPESKPLPTADPFAKLKSYPGAEPNRTYEKDVVTTKLIKAKDWRVTVYDNGNVTIRSLEAGVENPAEIPIKPGQKFYQGEGFEGVYEFTLRNDGGMYLEGIKSNGQTFILPLRSTESSQTDLISAKYEALTVTEIAVPTAESCDPKTSKEFREARTEVNIDLKALSMRPQERGDLTKGRQNRPEVTVYEAKTTEFEGREAKKTQKARLK